MFAGAVASACGTPRRRVISGAAELGRRRRDHLRFAAGCDLVDREAAFGEALSGQPEDAVDAEEAVADLERGRAERARPARTDEAVGQQRRVVDQRGGARRVGAVCRRVFLREALEPARGRAGVPCADERRRGEHGPVGPLTAAEKLGRQPCRGERARGDGGVVAAVGDEHGLDCTAARQRLGRRLDLAEVIALHRRHAPAGGGHRLAERRLHDEAVVVVGDEAGEGPRALARRVVDDARGVLLGQERQEINAPPGHPRVRGEGDHGDAGSARGLGRAAHRLGEDGAEDQLRAAADRLLGRALGDVGLTGGVAHLEADVVGRRVLQRQRGGVLERLGEPGGAAAGAHRQQHGHGDGAVTNGLGGVLRRQVLACDEDVGRGLAIPAEAETAAEEQEGREEAGSRGGFDRRLAHGANLYH